MLIQLSKLIQTHNLKIKGIIHVGGSHAEEADSYLNEGITRQLWIEAIPEVFEKMKQKLDSNIDAIAIQACISDQAFKNVTFYVTNNAGQSSSFLPLKKHKEYHPDVTVERTIEMITLTLDDVVGANIQNPYFNSENYNFLNMDIQGAELLALKGFSKGLKNIDYVYLEVNSDELYEGCALVTEIDEYLAQYGFEPKECVMTEAQWGDKFYVKKK